MKYENRENIDFVDMWNNMQTKLDLLILLNNALYCIYGNDTKPIDYKHLDYYAYSSLGKNKKRYVSFQIPKKKKGEFRTIDAPCSGLKTIQQCLNIMFQEIYAPHSAAMGFVQNRSVVDGAMVHLKQKFVYNIDLKDFFPSVTAGRLYNRLQSKPFSLNSKLASVITDLCCYKNAEGKNVLPQGAPTSPTITNFICERLDRKLSKLAKAYNLKYSRYADDITFSGMANVFKEDGKFCTSLKNIIENEEHFTINQEKTRLLHRGNRQEVTGITVNEKPNVSRKYVKQLRTLIHNWEFKGYNEAQRIFLEKYNQSNLKNHDCKGTHHIENIISGKLDYLKMVKGESDGTYKKLRKRFEILYPVNTHKENTNTTSELEKNEIIKNKDNIPEPKQTYEFLSFFSQNDGGLKNLTHDFNYGYIDYDVFMAQCKKEFEEGKKKFPKVPARLLGRIEAFAFRESPEWYIQKWLQKERTIIKHGWSDLSFVEWYKTNKLHPSKDAFYNKEMIIPFKESIQVRADTGNLISLLKSLIKKVFGEIPSCNVTISEKVKDAQFYTDVDSLGQALYQIFSTIQEYSEKNFCDEVEIDYHTEGEFKVLTVTHVDSKPTKRADDKDYSGGNTDAIKKQLKGLCNYEICAVFPDGPYRKIILSDNYDVFKKGLVPIDANSIKGYTHKMLFY